MAPVGRADRADSFMVGLALAVRAFVCAFVSAFVCSFRGLFACVLSWVEICVRYPSFTAGGLSLPNSGTTCTAATHVVVVVVVLKSTQEPRK